MNPELNTKWLVSAHDELTLRRCMEEIEQNTQGAILLTEPTSEKLIGVLTDGDIRRALLGGAALNDCAQDYATRQFISVDKNTSRERILKLFDQGYAFVPMLDENGTVVRVITPQMIDYMQKSHLIACAKAPARISFGGGGTDLTDFFMEHSGAVFNATVAIYSHCTLKKRTDNQIKIVSHDFGQEINCQSIANLSYNQELDLVKAIIRFLKPDYGFELEIASDFPPSSGLGGSSVVSAAVISCFNEFRDDPLTKHEMAELAFHAERIELGYQGGWQDQYASVFGGFSFMEFSSKENEVFSLKVPENILNELEERLILCYSGQAHPTNSIHGQQKANMKASKKHLSNAHKTRDIAYQMKTALLRGQVSRLGELLHEAWNLKKTLADGISDSSLDSIYELGLRSGALGGKILGAGGGGFFLFISRQGEQYRLRKALEAAGFNCRDVNFDDKGVRSWISRSELH